MKLYRLFALTLLLFVTMAHQSTRAEIWREVSIPTRAAEPRKYLLADLYANDRPVAKPVILIQTPYNKAFYRLSLGTALNNSGASVPYDSTKYHYVVVDWRGFYANKAAAITPYDRGQDGYDIVEWIATQPWCNGRVGTWGGSALGMIQFQTAALRPPHLVCAAPFIKDFKTKYEDYYYGGDFRREHVESLVKLGFMANVDNILAHPAQDATWNVIEFQSDNADKYAVPMFLCSGWFDHFPDDVLRAFNDLQTKSDASVRHLHKLMFGPWLHSSIGLEKQGILNFTNAAGVPTEMGMKFFDYYLRNESNGWETEPTVQYYQMGENTWKTAASWSNRPLQFDTLYFHEAHVMNSTEPGFEKRLSPPDTVLSDPRNPVPTIGGSRFNPFDKSIPLGPQDVSSLLTRKDIWYYESDSLATELILRGESTLELNLLCSTSDADISARLCDVFPDGRWVILTQGIQRLRFRNSLGSEELMPLNTYQTVNIHLQNVANTFLPGHRLGLVLSAANYPMFDLNLNDGKAMYTSGDTTNSTIMISHARPNYSRFVYATEPHLTDVEDASRSQSPGMDIHPNPAGNSITIHINDNQQQQYAISVLSLLGEPLYTIQGLCSSTRETVNIDLSAAHIGTYVVRLETPGERLNQVLHIVR